MSSLGGDRERVWWLSVSPAHDGRPPEMARQDRQSEATSEIAARFEPLPGYGGMRFEPDYKTVTLWWTGDIPAELLALTSSRVHGVTVNIELVPYSTKEFRAECRSLLGQAKKQGFELAMIGPSSDHTHLDVLVEPGVDPRRVYALNNRIPLEVTVGPGGRHLSGA